MQYPAEKQKKAGLQTSLFEARQALLQGSTHTETQYTCNLTTVDTRTHIPEFFKRFISVARMTIIQNEEVGKVAIICSKI
jgi:hypothetical protein